MPLAAIGIGSAIGGIGSIIAGNTQANAADNAAQLQAQEAQNALGFQEQEFGTQQANEAPFLQAGQGAVQQLSGLMQPGGSLSQPWTGQFQAPTAQQAAATPGYQFQLQQGTQALQNSAAGQGALNTGATGAALEQYGQGLASTDYQQDYNNALTQYQTAYNTFQNNQANQYNRLAGLAGIGQVTAGQLGQQGAQAAGNVGNIDLTAGQQQGANINLAGAANASGYAGLTNALSGGFSNANQYMSQMAQMSMLQQLMNPQSQGSSGGASPYGSYS
jgi:hypothetical protein